MKQPDVDVTVFISAGVIIKDDARDIIEDVDPDFFTGREPDPHLPPEYLRAIPILVAVESFLTIAEFDAVATDTYPVLATIVQIDVANSLGDSQTVYQYGVVETPESIIEAIEAAETIFLAANGMQQISGPINPCEQIWGCWKDPNGQWDGCPPEADVTPECCACISTYGSGSPCFDSCRNKFIAYVLGCLGVGIGSASGCMWKCMKPTGFLGPVGIKACATICGLTGIGAAAGCIYGAIALRRACEADCLVNRNQCLIDQGCPQLID